MRMILCLTLLGALLLAACSPEAPAPTLAPPAPDAAPDSTPAAEAEDGGTAPDGDSTPPPVIDLGMTLPLVGTMVTAVPTEELNPDGEDRSLALIIYEQRGGPVDERITVEVHRDGRLIRNGAETRLDPATFAQLAESVETLNLFGIQGQFIVPGAPSDIYRYRVTLERADGAGISIDAMDGHTPPDLLRFFGQLSRLGTPAQGQ